MSTTGFAEGIKEYANQKNIELRTVSRLTTDDVRSWLGLTHMTIVKRSGSFELVKLIVDHNEPSELQEAIKKRLATLDYTTPALVSNSDGKTVSIQNAFHAIADQERLYDDLECDNGKKAFVLDVSYPNDEFYYSVETEKASIRIRRIIFKGKIYLKKASVPVAQLNKYKTDDQNAHIADSASFEFCVDGKQMQMGIHKIADSGECHFVISTSEKQA